jgi:CheY-like chemotaxis protein
MLCRSLESWGYEVVTAADGEQAERILNSPDAPRMAILDCHMPGLDGLEV